MPQEIVFSLNIGDYSLFAGFMPVVSCSAPTVLPTTPNVPFPSSEDALPSDSNKASYEEEVVPPASPTPLDTVTVDLPAGADPFEGTVVPAKRAFDGEEDEEEFAGGGGDGDDRPCRGRLQT